MRNAIGLLGTLAMVLLMSMVVPVSAESAQATGSAYNNGFVQLVDTAAAGEGDQSVAQASSSGYALYGETASSSSATAGPGEETADTSSAARGYYVRTGAEGTAVSQSGTASAGPGFTYADGNDVTAGSNSYAGYGSLTDISGNTYTGNKASNSVYSDALGFPGYSESSNTATATE